MTEIEICNIALDFIGANNISSLLEDSREAKLCSRHFNLARDSMLESHVWGFVEKREALALIDGVDATEFSKYDLAYRYPADCLVAQKIYNPSSETERIDWKLQIDETKTDVMILTSEIDAQLIYTATTEAFNVMRSNLFRQALAYKLASQITMALKQDSQLADRMLNMYEGHAIKASGKDSNEEHDQPKDFDAYIDART